MSRARTAASAERRSPRGMMVICIACIRIVSDFLLEAAIA
jgi:hypothetical protein